jgi:hypothetical protein
VLDVRRRPRSGRRGYPEEGVCPAGTMTCDLMGHEFAKHSQRSSALARREVDNALSRVLLSYSAGFVILCNICPTVHLGSPFLDR